MRLGPRCLVLRHHAEREAVALVRRHAQRDAPRPHAALQRALERREIDQLAADFDQVIESPEHAQFAFAQLGPVARTIPAVTLRILPSRPAILVENHPSGEQRGSAQLQHPLAIQPRFQMTEQGQPLRIVGLDPCRGDLGGCFGQPIAGEQRPTQSLGPFPQAVVQCAAAHHHGTQTLRGGQARGDQVMDLGRNQGRERCAAVLCPENKFRRIPVAQVVTRHSGQRGTHHDAETSDVEDRQGVDPDIRRADRQVKIDCVGAGL